MPGPGIVEQPGQERGEDAPPAVGGNDAHKGDPGRRLWGCAAGRWGNLPKPSVVPAAQDLGQPSRVQPQELTSRTMTPLPVSMWVVQGMHGSKLRMARRTSMPLI